MSSSHMHKYDSATKLELLEKRYYW